MDLSLIAIYVVGVILLVATPGPVVALVIKTSIQSGPRTALMTVLGTNWASLLLIFIAALIINEVVSVDQTLLNLMSTLGCLFLAWVAVEGIVAGFTQSGVVSSPQETGGKRSGFGTGFMVGISNPKDILFFVSLFPQFINISDSVLLSLFILTAIWIVVDFSVLLSYIYLVRGDFGARYGNLISVLSSFFILLFAIAGGVMSAMDAGF